MPRFCASGSSLPPVQLEAFEGPLDLLLDEVRRQSDSEEPSFDSVWDLMQQARDLAKEASKGQPTMARYF